jgi:hypothetical protein
MWVVILLSAWHKLICMITTHLPTLTAFSLFVTEEEESAGRSLIWKKVHHTDLFQHDEIINRSFHFVSSRSLSFPINKDVYPQMIIIRRFNILLRVYKTKCCIWYRTTMGSCGRRVGSTLRLSARETGPTNKKTQDLKTKFLGWDMFPPIDRWTALAVPDKR